MNLIKFTLIAVLAVFVAGCASSSQRQIIKQSHINRDPRIIIGDASIENWLKFEGLAQSSKQDLMRVQARCVNTSNSNKKVAYNVIWKDQDGMVIKTILSRWVVNEIEAHRNLTIQATAPSIHASDFEIEIQDPTRDDKKRSGSYQNRYSN